MFRYLCFLLLAVSLNVQAVDDSPSVFYPLPTQAQGKVFAAKQLFLANDGGLWMQDVRNQVLFYDGQNIAPKSGSVLKYDQEKIAYLDNAFWSFVDNEIYKTIPNHERELVFSLMPGIEIKNIGASKRYIWVSDETNFYTYQIDTGEFHSYSLMELYQYTQSSKISINDAQLILSKWVLATNAGVYLSEGGHFSHIPSSGKTYVEKLYFSDKRRELIVGSREGALIFDIQNSVEPVAHVATSHVLSIAETDREYWIGTKRGLFIYSFMTGEISRLNSRNLPGYTLSGGKIYSLVNDHVGGIWLATDRGIRYASLFGDKFKRFSTQFMAQGIRNENMQEIIKRSKQDAYWLGSNKGVYSVTLDRSIRYQQYYQGKVHELRESHGQLWLATDNGLRCLDAVTGKNTSHMLPEIVKQSAVEHVDISEDGLLWGGNRHQLWSFDLNTKEYTDYGSDWLLSNQSNVRISEIKAFNNNMLAIGTDHGIYLVRDGKVRYIADTHRYGQVASLVDVDGEYVWAASSYGLFRVDLFQDVVQKLPLADDYVTPKCLLSNSDGVWLATSSGLSRYTSQGSLEGEFGPPFGLINNEFLTDICTNGGDKGQDLVFGSRFGLIKVDSPELLTSSLPDTRVILSQVKVNRKLISLGASIVDKPSFAYGDSIGFQFGVIPQVSNLSLEYRLNGDDSWRVLDGFQLTVDHLMPGDYQLAVRRIINDRERSQENTFYFQVLEPWYFTSYAIVTYVLLVVTALAGVVYWRSRIMARTNKVLKAQVALKTNQLRHQSRILVSNNHQLRKQLQVRRIIFSQVVQQLKDKLNKTANNLQGDEQLERQKLVRSLSSELEMLLNVHTDNKGISPLYNLGLVVSSVLSGWEEEFTKMGLSVETDIGQHSNLYIVLDYFNLDEVFSILFDSLIKRSYRNQIVTITIQAVDERVRLSMLDQGNKIDSSATGPINWTELRTLVEQSGGEMNLHTSDERNLIELSWVCRKVFDESSVVDAIEPSEQEESISTDPWIEKLEQLVHQHYSDSEFGTSQAAKLMYVSERSLQRRFKSSMSRTFKDYLNEVRLDYACRRLLAGEKVSEVAFECGFNDPSYFSQRFKHRFGVSPSQFVEAQESDDTYLV
ncbi:helix-turn-helix domain-containing protein [Vibrio sp. TRT 21S02]|uniref:helix-turn-helix domain-containing protein n=1 Tax=Vibrio sp. TRT 21S02 TaxID=3418507 RepID=UPI003CECECB6